MESTLSEVVDLTDALENLAEVDAGKAKLVELKLFAGLTIPEISAVLYIAEPTVKRHWSFAQAWLTRELNR